MRLGISCTVHVYVFVWILFLFYLDSCGCCVNSFERVSKLTKFRHFTAATAAVTVAALHFDMKYEQQQRQIVLVDAGNSYLFSSLHTCVPNSIPWLVYGVQ